MKVTVFSGTADGRKLCEWLAEQNVKVKACVATEYGASLMGGADVHAGRLDEQGMEKIISGSDIVIDATHPYADKVTRNISEACREAGIRCLRLIREETKCSGAIYVDSVSAAAEYLKNKEGRIFVSTGSKELYRFSEIGNRVSARVLDTDDVRQKCEGLGIKDIIYKAPPFSYEENMRDFNGCKFLVTKDGGKTGGMPEKLKAAESLGMTVIIVKRPSEGNGGMEFEDIKKYMKKILEESNAKGDGWKP